MKIYADEEADFPCKALDLEKHRNTMVLGEGAAMLCLEAGEVPRAIAKITGIGYATEELKHIVSISANGFCFQKSMKMAVGERSLKDIDVIVMHAPGTVKGDMAEYRAIRKLFSESLPALTSNKWKIGHTFGASDVLSLELAILVLQYDQFIPVPFSDISRKDVSQLKNILVNAVGFGGNAVSILITAGE